MHDCELVNESDIFTFFRKNRDSISQSVIDLSFATKQLNKLITDWHIDEDNASGSDHEVIIFYIRTNSIELVNNPLCSEHFNMKKADWKLFSEELVKQAQNIDFSHLYSNHSELNELNTAATSLQHAIYAAAEKSISKTRFSEKSKPWWSDNLTEHKKILSL